MRTERAAGAHLPKFPELDGIRGIAALAVFLHHVAFASVSRGNFGPLVEVLRVPSEYGAAGVDLFFVLSGFLITSLLLLDRGSSFFYRDFYWKRVLRILPLYVVCLLVTLIFFAHSASYVLMAAFFVANFSSVIHIPAVGGPFWSLAVEEQFYLLWPTVVRRRTVEQVTRWAVTVGVLCVALRLAAAVTIAHHNYFLTFLRCDGLAIGAWIGCRLHRRRAAGTDPHGEDPLLWTAIAGGVLLFGISHFVHGGSRAEALAAALMQTAYTLCCGGLIGLCITHTGSRATAWARARVLTFFGLISYAFYMIHGFVYQLYDHYRPLQGTGTASYFTRFFVILFVSVALSLVSRYLIELPALSLRGRVLHRPSPAETEEPLLTT